MHHFVFISVRMCMHMYAGPLYNGVYARGSKISYIGATPIAGKRVTCRGLHNYIWSIMYTRR